MMRAFASTKRGRPKRAAIAGQGANHNQGANDNQPDRGTPELQRQRAQLTRGLDPAASAHPLDLLLAKGWIEGEEQAAGLRYAALYRRLHGRVTVSYGRFYDGLAAGVADHARLGDEDDLAHAEQRFRLAKAALGAAGLRARRVTEGVAVFGCWPGWLFLRSGAAHRDCAFLRAGLAALQLGLARQQVPHDGR